MIFQNKLIEYYFHSEHELKIKLFHFLKSNYYELPNFFILIKANIKLIHIIDLPL